MLAGLFLCLLVCLCCLLSEIAGRLTWVKHRSRKSSATHSYQCVQYLCVSKRWYGCRCLGFSAYTQMLMHAIDCTRGLYCTHTIRESALEVDSGRKSPCHTGDSNPHQYCAWLLVGRSANCTIPVVRGRDGAGMNFKFCVRSTRARAGGELVHAPG